MKRSFKERLILFTVKLLSRPLLLIYRSTLTVKIKNRKYVDQCRKKGQNILYSFWHENMILPMFVHEFQGAYVLVSQHFDGEIIATILRAFGYFSIRGSSTRGGKEAYNQMKELLVKQRSEMAFTPDGPRGPRREAKIGIIKLAAETGSPIIPIAVAANRYIRLNSWDRLFIILPFSKCSLVYHEPFNVPQDSDFNTLENYTQKLTRITVDLEQEAKKCLAS
jgi:lysophospholipid acyltransferase (LPLAT)-like uncharacterized protein